MLSFEFSMTHLHTVDDHGQLSTDQPSKKPNPEGVEEMSDRYTTSPTQSCRPPQDAPMIVHLEPAAPLAQQLWVAPTQPGLLVGLSLAQGGCKHGMLQLLQHRCSQARPP